MKRGLGGSIEGMRVPGEAVPDWLETLNAVGFSQKEIDLILANLSDEYFLSKFGTVFEKATRDVEQVLTTHFGKQLSEAQRKAMREVAKAAVLEEFRTAKNWPPPEESR